MKGELILGRINPVEWGIIVTSYPWDFKSNDNPGLNKFTVKWSLLEDYNSFKRDSTLEEH